MASAGGHSHKALETPAGMAQQDYSRGIGKRFAFSVAIIAISLYIAASYQLPDWSWTQQLLSKPARLAPHVNIINGTYEGIYSDEYKQDYFLGIPYAKVPERFTVAKSLEDTWDGTRHAKAYPYHCVGYGDDHIGYEASEDCLYLNIVRPAGIDDKADLPVAVWIHGGGLAMGGSADSRYNLSFIVQQSVAMGTPMIGVSLNYRLSAFGFLNGKQALDAGVTNIGFRDQRLALHWIQENIAAFGGSASKVALWGESSGAESVTAQIFAYNGRDDGLFRAAIGQSGFGGMLARLPEGFNATSTTQKIYDQLVSLTSCAHLVGSDQSIDCLRAIPFDEINDVLSKDGLGPWPPVLDGDFFQGFITNQLESRKFVQVPLLIGTNSDEGTGFGMGRGPNGGGVNTDDEFGAMLSQFIVSGKHDEKIEEMVSELMKHYPNDQSVGIPSLETWPHIIQFGDHYAQQLGAQFRRVSAIIGDYTMHYLRRRANLAWKAHGLPSYAYRFDIVPNGIKDFIGSVHFQEVAFVFMNFDGNGYAANPFGGDDEQYIAKAKAVSTAMGSAWINFVTSLDPNGDGGLRDGIVWPKYDASKDVGQNLVWNLKGSPPESDDWREEGIEWFIRHALSVFGN